MPDDADLLADFLQALPRRYAGAAAAAAAPAASTQAAARLARCIAALQDGDAAAQVADSLEPVFCQALAELIHEALAPQGGEPAFQALLLEQRSQILRDYLALLRQQGGDRRRLRTRIDAIAHPAKPPRHGPPALRQALAQLHAQASREDWQAVAAGLARLNGLQTATSDPILAQSLLRLTHDEALERLQRLQRLALQDDVLRYEALRDLQGPRPGSPAAAAQAQLAHERGLAVEIRAAQALQALADYLDQGNPGRHRVVTSLRVPAALSRAADHAKTEWDAVLLRRDPAGLETTSSWDIALIVEAKASLDAATTDLPRLLRGLRLLAGAEPDRDYAFASQQGLVSLRGLSLHHLPTQPQTIASRVLYCSDAPPDPDSLPGLNPASRMQLLSAPASLAYASQWTDGLAPDCRQLAPLWHELRAAPRWQGVLNMDRHRQRARALMVHPDDLLAAVAARTA
ncbi:3-deoxy-D-arabino-heptulosonate 7-phosphate synthase [Bordetella trematum]|uniref:3-deoxy-D-arabino-heptulosonate 7-phosphate synthase n=1 Tax=Bordetella trematum TaxID=123899 RepID=UPI001404A1B2|nr:3-deoxy-D-arabino-heptulosonate 7-phosphate synthase [Bordetella trematum]QIM72333.1 3-deoxy-D-arabino-heptulosonate 7-phosphate synthase [Bordetella trematum]